LFDPGFGIIPADFDLWLRAITEGTNMAKCGYCNATVMFGLREGDQRFCNEKCKRNAYVMRMSQLVPAETLEREVEAVYRSNCPKCNLPGPVDVHKYHEVLSFVVMIRWTTKQQISCHSCGRKRQLGAIALSFFGGWWGFPFGLILTPIQITRNIIAMCAQASDSQPSPTLRKLIQVHLGEQVARNQQLKSAAPPLRA
jgi:hypothetical protein